MSAGKAASCKPALALVILSLAAAGALRAQPPVVQDPDPSEVINYAYTLDSGFGGFSVSGRSVQAYRIPFSYTLRHPPVPGLQDASSPDTPRPPQLHPWGLRITLPVSFGIHDLTAVLEGDQRITESFRTLTFVPGVEFQVPAGPWLLKPFAEVGFGKEFSTGGEWVLIYATGLKALRELERGLNLWSLGAGVEWDGTSAVGGDFAQDYGLVEAGVDFRFPLGASLAGRPADSSVYLVLRYFLSDLVFERLTQEPIEIQNQYEIGVTFGTKPPMRVWRLKLPRIGLSYRFGGDLKAYRLNFGFPF